MGTDKALLTNANGMTFAGNLLNCFSLFGCNPVVLVVNEQFNSSLFNVENLKIIINHQLEKGRAWSIHLGFKQVPEGDACFIQNIDNPCIEPGLLDLLLDSVTPDSYVVPMYNRHGGHPILLGSKIVAFFRSQSDIPDFRQALQCYSRTEISYPDERILWNINTPAEYQRYIRVR
jgi:CTP:molybdopterin cytidylyltransferase MocA